jgi:hypothetical protein
MNFGHLFWLPKDSGFLSASDSSHQEPGVLMLDHDHEPPNIQRIQWLLCNDGLGQSAQQAQLAFQVDAVLRTRWLTHQWISGWLYISEAVPKVRTIFPGWSLHSPWWFFFWFFFSPASTLFLLLHSQPCFPLLCCHCLCFRYLLTAPVYPIPSSVLLRQTGTPNRE